VDSLIIKTVEHGSAENAHALHENYLRSSESVLVPIVSKMNCGIKKYILLFLVVQSNPTLIFISQVTYPHKIKPRIPYMRGYKVKYRVQERFKPVIYLKDQFIRSHEGSYIMYRIDTSFLH
jgi:hypothetical protein